MIKNPKLFKISKNLMIKTNLYRITNHQNNLLVVLIRKI
jgi:hypothetical protein